MIAPVTADSASRVLFLSLKIFLFCVAFAPKTVSI